MAQFTDLPSEVILQILEPLRIPDLHAFGSVCRHFDAVIKENSTSVYRLAAILHGYVSRSPFLSSGELLEQAAHDLYGSSSLTSMPLWLDLCKTRWRIDQAWSTPSFPTETIFFTDPEDSIPRICRDGEALLLSTLGHNTFGMVNALKPRVGRNHIKWTTSPEGELVFADGGFLLFKVRPTLYRIWSRAGPLHSAPPDSAGLRLVGDIRLNGKPSAAKLKDGCLMMATDENTLHIFDLALVQFDALPGDENILTPSGVVDLGHVGYTTAIEFSEKYIFHCSTVQLRILCRTTHRVLYTIHEATWRKVALGKWVKCISSNVFYVPPPVPSRFNNNAGRPRVQEEVLADEVVYVERGTGERRKDAPWRWDVMQIVYGEGTLVMSFGGGWIVGLPDVEMLVSGERTWGDAGACWVLDIGAPASDVLFDGRRIVWNHYHRISILNLHGPDAEVHAGTPVVRLSQRDWTAIGNPQTMVLTNRSIWFLGGERAAGWERAIHLVHWEFVP